MEHCGYEISSALCSCLPPWEVVFSYPSMLLWQWNWCCRQRATQLLFQSTCCKSRAGREVPTAAACRPIPTSPRRFAHCMLSIVWTLAVACFHGLKVHGLLWSLTSALIWLKLSYSPLRLLQVFMFTALRFSLHAYSSDLHCSSALKALPVSPGLCSYVSLHSTAEPFGCLIWSERRLHFRRSKLALWTCLYIVVPYCDLVCPMGCTDEGNVCMKRTGTGVQFEPNPPDPRLPPSHTPLSYSKATNIKCCRTN